LVREESPNGEGRAPGRKHRPSRPCRDTLSAVAATAHRPEQGDVPHPLDSDLFMPSAVAILKRSGIDEPILASAGGTPCRSIDIVGTGRRLWQLQYSDEALWMLPRRSIDQTLREALSPTVSLRYGSCANAIQADATGSLRITYSHSSGYTEDVSCSAVILACGTDSALSRRWGICGESELVPSISAYINDPRIHDPTFWFARDCQPGYRWLFPVRDGLVNVGVCSLAHARGSTLKAFGQSLLQQDTADRNTLAGWRRGALERAGDGLA
jgi:flavin-dependent dehydrogenase